MMMIMEHLNRLATHYGTLETSSLKERAAGVVGE
jgi:hypothetical protein